jgi:hypothetical protein
MPYTLNGCGTRYYGKRDKADDGSYVTSEWITFLYFPLVPIRSFRVWPISSQRYQTLRVPLCWSQVWNVYFFITPIVLLMFYVSQHIDGWLQYYAMKHPSPPAHASLKAESSSPPVEQPLNSKDAAVSCGNVLKLEQTAFTKLDIISHLSTVVVNAGFTQQELTDLGDSEKNLEEQVFKAYSFAYLTWDKPTLESRADFDKMIVKVFNSQDIHTLSADERAEFEGHMEKVKRMMLQAFKLGRHDARISPCPVSS